MAALYFLFQSLRQVAPTVVTRVMATGSGLTLLLLVAIPFLPDSTPRTIIPVMYSILA